MSQQENIVYQDQILHDRINGKVKDDAKVGQRTLLLPEEMEIVEICIIFENLRDGMDKLKVMKIVQSYMGNWDMTGGKVSFKSTKHSCQCVKPRSHKWSELKQQCLKY